MSILLNLENSFKVFPSPAYIGTILPRMSMKTYFFAPRHDCYYIRYPTVRPSVPALGWPVLMPLPAGFPDPEMTEIHRKPLGNWVFGSKKGALLADLSPGRRPRKKILSCLLAAGRKAVEAGQDFFLAKNPAGRKSGADP